MKLVINRCYGGFGLSYKAVMRYAELTSIRLYAFIEVRDRNGVLGIPFNLKEYIFDEKEDPFFIYYSKDPLNENGKIEEDSFWCENDIERNDPILVRVVEELGSLANGHHSSLSIVEIPDNIEWEIDEYDGIESVEEKHRSWY